MLSIIIPASNEERVIGPCLRAIGAATDLPQGLEVIVVANGCRDQTAKAARAEAATLAARGWRLTVIELEAGGKPGALNAGDAAAQGAARLYLDADVTISPDLPGQIARALDRPDPAYASGTLRITARGGFSRAYARFWSGVPFMARGVPGCGLFAVNSSGRALWHNFPAIIADDTYVRLQFRPDQRIAVPAPYDWPIAEGFARLVRVRRRQDAGVNEIAELYPGLLSNDDKLPLGIAGILRLALRDPLGFLAYGGVALAVRLGPRNTGWSRGR
jgi:glycosyltransferase involved in cell wall biosynthesis